MGNKYVFLFADDISGMKGTPKEILGGKGAGLAEMMRLGVPVPPGFTITPETCNAYRRAKGFPDGLVAEVDAALANVEAALGRKLGDPKSPLLVSVRSGARVSMPGMMDTILNLGLNDETVRGLAAQSQNPRFAFDSYRRFIDMFANVVLGCSRHPFEHALHELKRSLGNASMPDSEVPHDALEKLVTQYRSIAEKESGRPFPNDVREQLHLAIAAVFRSWDNARAVRYRRMQDIPDSWGTGVTVQSMVFGNMGDDSGSGVAFTRNPSTGQKRLYGEFLPNAQGEDVVAGIRTPRPILADGADDESLSLERSMHGAFEEIVAIADRLESHFKDMQDIEFTIERGKVFILQTRNGKRTAHAAVRIATQLVDEGLADERQALLRVEPESLEQLLHASVPTPEELEAKGTHPLAIGLPASPGAATGRIVLHADDAEARASSGEDVILVRRETSPEDIHGMKAARGILTATGGMTSHAAVVARGLGRTCVAGSSAVHVDYDKQEVVFRLESGEAITMHVGDVITLDGTHGRVYRGEIATTAAAKLPELDRLMGWADRHRKLRVRTNADTPKQAASARTLGAEGIGLCRTEHMFFAEDRLEAVRCMVLCATPQARAEWLAKIEPMQQGDFAEILDAMAGLPVTIRLLDWPLHEFLPKEQREFESVARALHTSVDEVKRRADDLHEQNPMLGHRGVRLGLTDPAIYQTQARAIAAAAVQCKQRGLDVRPEIMIPIVSMAAELEQMRELVRETVAKVLEDAKVDLAIPIGTMIELPRACLAAKRIAEHADFFSFGTNDLTQTTFGLSRDDAGKFLASYVEQGLLQNDPFVRLDEEGVGELVKLAVERGRATKPDLKIGICGEHGGDPKSIAFAARAGVDYVSCSPPRLPIARLAAAQAAIRS